MKRCVQCWKRKLEAEFIGARGKPVTWCQDCRSFYRSGQRRATRRGKLDTPNGHTRYSFVRRSANPKLGGIPATMSSGDTCPDSCSLKDAGCFGEFGLLRMHWEEVGQSGLSFEELLARVRSLPDGQVWRHNVVGDLSGRGDRLDLVQLFELARAAEGTKPFTYTHKPLSGDHWTALYEARLMGFTVNVSCDGLNELDELVEHDLVGPAALPAVVVLPENAPPSLVSPRGARVVVCPAETRTDTTCASCRICARPERPFFIGFRAHGQWKAKVSELVQLRVKGKGNEHGGGKEGAGGAAGVAGRDGGPRVR